ncbi:MAG: hypothetical protein AAF667_03830 [Pseudomonadota bacterium]
MDLTLNSLISMVTATVRAPRDGARWALNLRLSVSELWMLVALVVLLGGLRTGLMAVLLPMPDAYQMLPPLLRSPFAMTFALGLVLVGFAYLLAPAGRALGGNGNTAASLIVMSWWQFVMFCLRLVELGVILISPFLGVLLQLGITGLAIWMLLAFVSELHGFDGVGTSAFAVLIAAVGVVLAMSLLMGLSGITLSGGLPNA